ncbi:MAG: hypothetical protein ACYTE8_01640 [Planctomycetota bacterium]|jgi:hypothetical protein
MTSQKRLKSVIHSIAHHSVSGLSYIHPHLGKACKESGMASVNIDLLAANPCPDKFRNIKPLQLSLNCLSDKFNEILKKEGFEVTDLESVILKFHINNINDYCTICYASIISKEGRKYEYKVDWVGDTKKLH